MLTSDGSHEERMARPHRPRRFDLSDFVNVMMLRKGEQVHMASARGIIVEKHSQLTEDNPKRKRKGCGVVLGNQIKNEASDAALFQDLGNSPATIEASRWADLLGDGMCKWRMLLRLTFRLCFSVPSVGLSFLQKTLLM